MFKHKLARMIALTKKEFIQMVRDPSSILIAVVLPLLLLFIYGVGISLDISNLKVGLAMEDSSPLVQSFVEALKESKYFDLVVERTQEPFYKQLRDGEIHGFVVIPSDFSKNFLERGNQAEIQVIADGSSPNTASFVQNYIRGAWSNWALIQEVDSGNTRRPKIKVEPRFWYNEELESHNFLVPGSIAIIMTLIGTLLTSVIVSREWERGTMESLLATQATIGEILFGKLFPNFCLGMISLVCCTLIAVFVYHVPFRGTFLLLMLVSAVFLTTALGVGLFISTLARNQFIASQMSIVASYLPGFMLSGFIFEISSMPTIIQYFTYLIPARYYVTALQTLFLVGDVGRLIVFNLFALSLFAIFIFGVTIKISRKRLD
jgi:ABC-2 type transport system permease protein